MTDRCVFLKLAIFHHQKWHVFLHWVFNTLKMKKWKKLIAVESELNLETHLKYFYSKHLNGQIENKLELLFITFFIAFNSWGILRSVHIQMFLSWGDGYKFGEKTPPDFGPRVTNSLKLTARFAPEKLDAWSGIISFWDSQISGKMWNIVKLPGGCYGFILNH